LEELQLVGAKELKIKIISANISVNAAAEM